MGNNKLRSCGQMSQENAENEEVREVSVKRSNRLTKEQDQFVA